MSVDRLMWLRTRNDCGFNEPGRFL